MALKSKRIYVTFLQNGQVTIHPSDGRGTRFKMIGGPVASKILKPKTSDSQLGREVRAMMRKCK